MKFPRRPASLAAFLCLALVLHAAQATPEEALAAKQAGDYPRAIALYLELAAQQPADSEILFQLGTVLGWAGRYNEALSVFERGLATAPRHTDLRLGHARVLAWMGRLEHAEVAARLLHEDAPGNADALILLGRIHAWRRNFSSAEEHYRQALALAPGNPDALTGLGDVKRAQECYPEARDYYLQAEKADPTSVEISRRLASVRQTGRWRLDAGLEHSAFSGGSPRSDWEGADAALRYTLDRQTGISFGAEWARRFDLTDEQYTLGLDRRFSDRLSGYARASATPSADFFAKHMLSIGGEWKARTGDTRLPPTVLLADYRAATYGPGTAHSLWLGATQYTNRRFAVTAKFLSSRNLNKRWTHGWQVRLDGEPSDLWRWNIGYSDSHESLSSTLIDYTRDLRTRAVFAGFYRELSPVLALRLDATHEWSPGAPARNALHAGIITRF